MKRTRQGACMALLALVASSGCTNSFFSGSRTERPAAQGNQEGNPQATQQPTAVSPGEIDAVEIPESMRAKVTIKVIRLNSDSWWKNCVDVGVFLGNHPTTQGMVNFACNKGEGGATEKVLIVHKEECNTLRIQLSIFENKGQECSRNPQAPCNGPYGETPDTKRSLEKPEERPFFLIFDARKVEEAVKDPGFQKFMAPKDKATVTNAPAGTDPGMWTRIFMEDQPQRNLQKFISAPDANGTREALGIDFDDYVLDVQAPAGLKLRFEGENSWMGAKPANFVVPPSTCL